MVPSIGANNEISNVPIEFAYPQYAVDVVSAIPALAATPLK